jgi:hypothetical protein
MIYRGFNLEAQQSKYTVSQTFNGYRLAVETVGSVGNSTLFIEFSKRCGNGGKSVVCFSTVSIARQFPQSGW